MIHVLQRPIPRDMFPVGLDPLHAPTANEISWEEQVTLLQEALALSDDAITISAFGIPGFLDCSPPAYQRLGYTREEYLALGPVGIQADNNHDEDWVSKQLDRIRDQGAGRFETRHRCSNGTAIDVLVYFRVLRLRGQELILALHRDRTELLRTRSRAERLNELLLEAEELTQVGSWELIHDSGELTWSEGTHRIFETDSKSFSPTYEAFLGAIHPEDRHQVDEAYQRSLRNREPYQVNHRLLMNDGRQKVLQERGSTTFDACGRPIRSIGTVQDISTLAAYEEQLQRAAYLDTLTELPNRQATIRHLAEQLSANKPDLAILNLDLDQFQAFNDTFGVKRGDELLRSVATALRDALPKTAFLARLESDEFLIALPCRREQVETKAVEVQQLLSRAVTTDIQPVMSPSVSIGACHAPSHGEDALTLLQSANTALMEAKRQGKGMVWTYSNAISERIRQRLELESQLEQAIADQSFQLVFQPQVNREGELVGAEVLLRWQDNQGSAIPPSVFIPLAEQTGQIHSISAWVMEETCRQLQEWQRQGMDVPRLAINLSAVELGKSNSNLPTRLLETLERYELNPINLELEITETALISDPEQSRIETMALSDAGFQIAIDDFGTGYASLVTLHSLPIDKIKIDTSFVQQIQCSDIDRAIVKSTILMAHELGLVALAEGVETQEQWRILRELNCDLFQGYLFGFPMAAAAFAKRLKPRRS
jgi:diguanylate cyclase (GGDEF)-like protein